MFVVKPDKTIVAHHLGYVYDLPTDGHYRIGIGGVVSTYAIPSALNATYGKNPNSAILFVRIKLQ